MKFQQDPISRLASRPGTDKQTNRQTRSMRIVASKASPAMLRAGSAEDQQTRSMRIVASKASPAMLRAGSAEDQHTDRQSEYKGAYRLTFLVILVIGA